MDGDALIDQLGYRDAAAFLDEQRWHQAIEHAHVFRHTAEACRGPSVRGRFRGVYMLGVAPGGERRATTPVVYLCEAPDATAADAIHHLVWNQAVVPFLLVHTPQGVRLYSGFDYDRAKEGASKAPRSQRGVLEAAIAFEQVADKLDAFRARHINDGGLWIHWGSRIDPARRVDVRLLDHLKRLGKRLRADAKLKPAVAHALIGRFVYLRYLLERGILSDTLLRSWNIDLKKDLGRSLDVNAFGELLRRVDDRLNGSIFPLALSGKNAPRAEHIRMVAGVMLGDDPETGQGHLDFRAYDFSHIPIETLSAIYEQFMAAEGRDRDAGGFYTPIPLVRFILGELDDLHPLKVGMRVLDPACGSGAFLVQCYQLLVEKQRRDKGGELSPKELRELLTSHIFGMDRDEDACRVTELSLALALLDQIPAETLTRLHNFKLPNLHQTNILCADFFEAEAPGSSPQGFDWVVGNPPWVEASPSKAAHRPALLWMKRHEKANPTSGNQMAEAFAWKASELLRPEGLAALVLPATTFFKEQRSFREAFLPAFDVKAAVNLTNLREVLFDGKARMPAFVLMYAALSHGAATNDDIAVYSPLVVNQEAIRPSAEGQRRAVWTITVDHAEVRMVPRREVADGDPLRWKLSMWGGPRDLKLLRSVARRFPSLETAAEGRWKVREGLPLREGGFEGQGSPGKSEPLVPIPEILGRLELLVGSLRDEHSVHSFPRDALREIPPERAFGRKGRVEVPLAVCQPPHVIVHAGRKFAVFSDTFMVIPPPHLGVGGAAGQEDLLRALALYLGSDFVWYHQFLTSPEMEYRGRSTIHALKRLPVPLLELSPAQIRAWVELHQALVALSDKRWEELAWERVIFDFDSTTYEEMGRMEGQVNQLAAEALGLGPRQQWLIDDLVHVRRHLADGKIGNEATRKPTLRELQDYAAVLRDELDDYLDRGRQFRHKLAVVFEARAGMVEIAFVPRAEPHVPQVEEAESAVGRRLRAMRDRMAGEHSQWLYFDRNLALYVNDKVYLSKPMQRLWWTRGQALADADRIIADLIAAGAKR